MSIDITTNTTTATTATDNSNSSISSPQSVTSVKSWLQNSLLIPRDVSDRIVKYEVPFSLTLILRGIAMEDEREAEHEVCEVAKDLGRSLNSLGLAKGREGLWNEALVIWSDALVVQRSALTIDILGGNEYSNYASDVACTLNNIGIAMFWLNRLEMGLTALQEALRARQLQSKDYDAIMDMDLAMTYHNIGNFKLRMKDYNGALTSFKQELSIKLALYNKGINNNVTDSTSSKVKCCEKDICLAYASLGNTCMKLGQFQDAKIAFEEETSIYRSMGLTDDHPEVMSALNNNAKCEFYETRAKRVPRV